MNQETQEDCVQFELTSPDSWANMDLKESSMSLSEISSCTEEEDHETPEVKGHQHKPKRMEKHQIRSETQTTMCQINTELLTSVSLHSSKQDG